MLDKGYPPLCVLDVALLSCPLGSAELINADKESTTINDVFVGIDFAVGREARAMK